MLEEKKVVKFEDKKGQILGILQQHNQHRACPVCNNSQFSIIPEFGNIFLQDSYGGSINIGGKSVPVVISSCTRCGHLEFFSAITLLKEPGDGN